MAIITADNVTVKISTTLASAATITGITKADPAVISISSHGLSNSVYGYLDAIEGMLELDDMAVRATVADAGTLELDEVDSTSYSDFSSGSLVVVTAWATLATGTGITVSPATLETRTRRTIHTNQATEVSSGLSGQTATFPVLADPQSAAAKRIRACANQGIQPVFLCTFEDGQELVFRGKVGRPGIDMAAGEDGTSEFSVAIVGEPLFLPAVA